MHMNRWNGAFDGVGARLEGLGRVGRVVAAFNTNIDAVVKVSGAQLGGLMQGMTAGQLEEGKRLIGAPADVLRGLFKCFCGGIAEEWLIEDPEVVAWISKQFGPAKMQMGGQAGIVANVLALCGVSDVLVHCAALPKAQAQLFLDLDNLRTTDSDGQLTRAYSISRESDGEMIHWILEFDRGDKLVFDGKEFVCPKSNRFIATYDPMNFAMTVDANFDQAAKNLPCDLIFLSGYHLLSQTLADGGSGTAKIDETFIKIASWGGAAQKEGVVAQNESGALDGKNPLVHLEFASTSDLVIRHYLLDSTNVFSIGLNERETIDLLELLDPELAKKCSAEPNSANLFVGIQTIMKHTGVKRVQLHMFGLYVTLLAKDAAIKPEDAQGGMALASVVAASKALGGSLNVKEDLLRAAGMSVAQRGLDELERLAKVLGPDFRQVKPGIWLGPAFDVVALPTILVDKPLTLVGVGDTISSLSLVGSMVAI